MIIHGLEEGTGDAQEDLLTKFYNAISLTINRETQAERFKVASEVEVIKIRRLGKRDEKCIRPVSIVEQIYDNRFSLEGIYTNREYNKEMEENRRLLRPILKAAKKNARLQG